MEELTKVDKKKKTIDTDAVIDNITPPIPENCFIAKGSFNTVKGMVKAGDIVCIDDLIGSFVDLEKAGLA